MVTRVRGSHEGGSHEDWHPCERKKPRNQSSLPTTREPSEMAAVRQPGAGRSPDTHSAGTLVVDVQPPEP